MHKLLDEYLCKKYPKIFIDRDKGMDESCMHWGLAVGDGWFYLIDTLCENIQSWVDNPQWIDKKDPITKFKSLWNRTVWNWIIYPLIKNLPFEEYQRLSKHFQFNHAICEPPPFNLNRQVKALQVKEKFGGLRFYTSGGNDDYVRGMISMAESLSFRICERCGKMDKDVSATKGWITTICPACAPSDVALVPRNSADKKLAKIWEKISKENNTKGK
jgi:hypothetical protein